MRIRLRLYSGDLDLIALKYNRNFNLSSAIKRALLEYVTLKECSRIQVPPDTLEPITLSVEQLDISLNDERYADVITWLRSIHKGMRSYAVKSILRSAIANPCLDLFYIDKGLLLTKAATHNMMMDDAENNKQNTEFAQSTGKTSKTNGTSSGSGTNVDSEFDLFENEFFEQY